MLTELVQFAELNQRIGMVGQTMYCFDSKDRLYEAGGFIRWNKEEIWHRGIYQPVSLYSDHMYPEPADFIAGCRVLVKRRLVLCQG
jgi:GT2 family glycosyltransferase